MKQRYILASKKYFVYFYIIEFPICLFYHWWLYTREISDTLVNWKVTCEPSLSNYMRFLFIIKFLTEDWMRQRMKILMRFLPWMYQQERKVEGSFNKTTFEDNTRQWKFDEGSFVNSLPVLKRTDVADVGAFYVLNQPGTKQPQLRDFRWAIEHISSNRGNLGQ